MAKRKVQASPAVNPLKPGIAQHGMVQQTVQRMAKQKSRPADSPARPRGSGLQGSSLANSGDGMVTSGHNAPRGYIGDDGTNPRTGMSLYSGSTPLTRSNRRGR